MQSIVPDNVQLRKSQPSASVLLIFLRPRHTRNAYTRHDNTAHDMTSARVGMGGVMIRHMRLWVDSRALRGRRVQNKARPWHMLYGISDSETELPGQSPRHGLVAFVSSSRALDQESRTIEAGPFDLGAIPTSLILGFCPRLTPVVISGAHRSAQSVTP